MVIFIICLLVLIFIIDEMFEIIIPGILICIPLAPLAMAIASISPWIFIGIIALMYGLSDCSCESSDQDEYY